MSEAKQPAGKIAWCDLTVPDAKKVRDFYAAVAGWSHESVDMGDYQDYCMKPTGGGDPVAGICHQRGPNAEMPAQWLLYVTVPDLEKSLARCEELGGTVLHRRSSGPGAVAVLRDPAGAVLALYQT